MTATIPPTHVFADFGGDRRKFELTIGGAGELERRCNAGIGAIAVRLATHQFYLGDVRQSILLGLQGGGMAEPDAHALVRFELDGKPLDRWLGLAGDIVGAFLSGAQAAFSADQKKTVPAGPPPLAT